MTAVVDIDEPKNGVNEDVSIGSRWRETGAGRSDITIAGGSLPATIAVVEATECWGEDFSQVFYTDSVESKPTVGRREPLRLLSPAFQASQSAGGSTGPRGRRRGRKNPRRLGRLGRGGLVRGGTVVPT